MSVTKIVLDRQATAQTFPFGTTSASGEALVTLYKGTAAASTVVLDVKGSQNIGGDLNLTGNLNITGSINEASVTNLLVTDITLTLNNGGTTPSDDTAGILMQGTGASLIGGIYYKATSATKWSIGDGTTQQDIVGISATQTLTNKTLTSPTLTTPVLGTPSSGTLSTGIVLGGVTLTLGSDASYDTYYRNASGVLTRLANGTTGQYLGANTGAAPSWQTPAGSGTVNSGTQYRIAYYATTGTAVSEAAAITASRALVSDANGVPTHSNVTTTNLEILRFATGATGSTSSNVVFSGTPTLATPIFTGLPTGTGVASAATASTLAARDANANLSANNFLSGYTTTATAAGTTTLTVGSTQQQYFTGTTTQTVTLPVATTLANGQSWLIVNNSTNSVTIQTSGANTLLVLGASTSALVTCTDTAGGTGTASWNYSYLAANVASGKVLTVSNTLTLAGTDGSTLNIGTGGTLGTNAYTSTAYAPIASPTFTGTVTIPTPFTLGATSVTSTGTQLNYLNAATGTTGTTSTNLVFSTSPTLVTPVLGAASATSLVLSSFLNEAQGSNIASATTTNIGAATGNYVNITGTTTITAFDTVQAGTRRILNFNAALTLTYNATSLILPTSANITTAAGDTATFVSLGSGNWVCTEYQRRTGVALVASASSTYQRATVVSGTQDSANKVFAIANAVSADSEQIYINGQLLTPGSSNDYVLSGTTLTFQAAFTAPAATDVIRAYGTY